MRANMKARPKGIEKERLRSEAFCPLFLSHRMVKFTGAKSRVLLWKLPLLQQVILSSCWILFLRLCRSHRRNPLQKSQPSKLTTALLWALVIKWQLWPCNRLPQQKRYQLSRLRTPLSSSTMTCLKEACVLI